MTQEKVDELEKLCELANIKVLEAKREYEKILTSFREAKTELAQNKITSFPYTRGDKLYYKCTYVDGYKLNVTEEADVVVESLRFINEDVVQIELTADRESNFIVSTDNKGIPLSETITLTKIKEESI